MVHFGLVQTNKANCVHASELWDEAEMTGIKTARVRWITLNVKLFYNWHVCSLSGQVVLVTMKIKLHK